MVESKVKITFIGTGDAVNTGGRAHQSILIQSENYKLLVDCGANTLLRFQELNLNPNDIDAVLFTHFHADHFFGIISFDLSLIFDYKRKRNIVYAGPVGLKEKYDSICQIGYSSIYPNDKFVREIHQYHANNRYLLGNEDIKVDTIAMKHAPESLGYRIYIEDKVISITGDTEWHNGIFDLANNSDIFICECHNYKKPIPRIGHLSYEEIQENFSQIKTQKMILVHTSKEFAENIEKCTISVASDGEIIEV